MAQCRIARIAVIEAVVIGQFLSRRNLPDGANNHSASDLVGFAVRVAGMIDEGSNTVAVDDPLAIT